MTSEQPLIDVKSSQRAYSITADQFVKLPKGRDFSSDRHAGAGRQLRGQVERHHDRRRDRRREPLHHRRRRDDQPAVGHAGQAHGRWTSCRKSRSSRPATRPSIGGSTGGVINVISRSGSNDFHGDAALYFNNDGDERGRARDAAPACRPTRRAAEYVTLPKDGSQRLEPGIGVGGPVMKDKLWFFASYLPSLEKFERSTQFSNGTPVDARADRRHPLLLGQRHVAADQQPRAARSPTTRPSAPSTASCRAARCRARTARRRRRRCSTPTTSGRTGRCRATTTTSSTTSSSSAPRGGYYKQDQYNEGIPLGDAVPLPARRTSAWPACPRSSSDQQRLHEHPDQPQRHAQHLRPRQLPGRWHLLRQLRRLAHAQGRRAVRPHRQRRARLRAEQPDPHQLGSRRSATRPAAARSATTRCAATA